MFYVLPAFQCLTALPPRRAAGRPSSKYEIASDERPLIVHYQREKDAELAEAMMEAVEVAWAVQVDELGFRAPAPDSVDGPELDVYLDDIPPFQGWAAGDGETDLFPGDGYMTTSSHIVLSYRLPPEEVPSFVAHEFNHVLQWGTDFVEPSLPIWEGTATAAQQWTLHNDDWEEEVYGFQDAPFAPAITGDSYVVWKEWDVGYSFEYGTAFWVLYLDEILEENSGVALWDALAQEGRVNEPDVVDAIEEVTGTTLGEFLNDFARIRFLTGKDWDVRGLPAAEDWGKPERVPRVERIVDVGVPIDIVFDPPLQITGQGFVELLPSGGERLELEVRSPAGDESGLVVLWWGEDGISGEVAEVAPEASASISLEGVTRVVAAVTNLGPAGWDADDDAYVDGAQFLHVKVTSEDGSAAFPSGRGREAETGGCGCSTVQRHPFAIVLVVAVAVVRRYPWAASRGSRREVG